MPIKAATEQLAEQSLGEGLRGFLQSIGRTVKIYRRSTAPAQPDARTLRLALVVVCSHSLYALAAISLSLGLAINVSPTMGPPLEGRDGHSAKLLLGLAAASMPGWLAKFLKVWGEKLRT